MSAVRVSHTNTREGVWHGVLQLEEGADPVPQVTVTHMETVLEGVDLAQTEGGEWALRFPIPVECLADGVQTFVISDSRTGEKLDSYTIVAGQALEDDFRAELDLLRAEMDMLKKAFRRHCLETA